MGDFLQKTIFTEQSKITELPEEAMVMAAEPEIKHYLTSKYCPKRF